MRKIMKKSDEDIQAVYQMNRMWFIAKCTSITGCKKNYLLPCRSSKLNIRLMLAMVIQTYLPLSCFNTH